MWDYNDEYSYTHDGEPGSPVAVFMDRAAAEDRCEELELSAWRGSIAGQNIGEWMYDTYASMQGEDDATEIATAKLRAVFPDLDDDFDIDEFKVPKVLTDEQIQVLRDVFSHIYFNHVQEVDLLA